MKRTILAAAALLLGTGAVLGQQPVSETKGDLFIARFVGMPAEQVTPPKDKVDLYTVPAGWAPITPYLKNPVILTYEPGGRLDAHADRFRAIAERGAEV